jgi:hypothetical protein
VHGSLCEKPGSERGIDVAILEAGSGKTDGGHSSAFFLGEQSGGILQG